MSQLRKRFRNENESLSKWHVREAQKGITQVSAFIHRIHLFTRDATLEDIQKVLGPIKPHLKEFNKSHHLNRYNTAGYGTFMGYSVTLYSHPIQPFQARFMLTITKHDQNFLHLLSECIPGLKMSSVEYSIDMHCKDNKSTSMLYYVLRRYMYFRNRADVSTTGGKFDGVIVTRRTNSVYNIYQEAKKWSKNITIYERGDDETRKTKGWAYKDVNRVRIEFLARSDNLRDDLSIKSLKAFVNDTKFSQFTHEKIDFRIFDRSNKLPKYSHDYESKDRTGCVESFQQEYFIARSEVLNISQYMDNAEFMTSIKAKILDAIKTFESKWKLFHKSDAAKH